MEKIKLVYEEETSNRLDKYIANSLENISRNYLQTLIKEQQVLVNGEVKKGNYKLKNNDEIIIIIPEVKELEALPQKMDLDILYEDKDIIVLNKAKGVCVHPSVGHRDFTLVNGLLEHCQDLSGINGVLRPGIVHRIDMDTTGCIVACKNDIAHELIAQQLANKTCHREYVALVHGVIPHNFGTIDAPIGRDSKDRQRMTVTENNSKEAITHFKVLERFKTMTLVSFKLETGRTHQIRVHMKYIGFPIVGDTKYGRRKTLDNTQGQVLHAERLTLMHPTLNKEMTFEAPLPEYFKNLLADIRGGLIE